jgi:hypothetical protein
MSERSYSAGSFGSGSGSFITPTPDSFARMTVRRNSPLPPDMYVGWSAGERLEVDYQSSDAGGRVMRGHRLSSATLVPGAIHGSNEGVEPSGALWRASAFATATPRCLPFLVCLMLDMTDHRHAQGPGRLL